MVAQMKELTDAQRLVQRLESEFSMTRAAIAHEIGVTASTVQNIAKLHTTGNFHVHRLKALADRLSGGSDPNQTHSNRDSIADLFAPVKETPEAAAIDLNADEPAPAEPKNLKDRASDWLRAAMLGSPTDPSSSSMTAPSRSKKPNDGDVSPTDIADQIAPLAALLLVFGGVFLLPNPYKSCGPTDLEAQAIIYPVIKRLARAVDARRKLSEADMELLAMGVAISAYGRRSYVTYQAIHAEEVQRARSSQSEQPNAASVFVAQSGPGTGAVPDVRAGTGSPTAAPENRGAGLQNGLARAGAVRANTRDAGASANGHDRAGDAAIADLLAADAVGRKRLGY